MEHNDFPTISLVIPAHNEEKYIGECLRYIIGNSDGKLLEIVVVDNASTDHTRTLAENFSGVRVVVETEKGLTSARQKGFIEARGDIIAYIDADTQMPKDWVEKIIFEFTKDENLACLSGPYLYHDISLLQRFFVKCYWYMLAYPIYLSIGYMTVGGNFAIKKSALEKMNGFDTTIAFYGEDTDIARRAKKFGKVKFSLNFQMPTSGRRLAGQGFLSTAMIYVINFVSEVLLHKPATREYKDIR